MRTLRDLRMTAGCANTMQEPCMLKATDRTLHDTIFLQTPEPWSHSTGACP